MNHNNSSHSNQNAHVDPQCVRPFPASTKHYVLGSRTDIRVPMRLIALSDRPMSFGGAPNQPVLVYDTSGAYTDPAVTIDVRKAKMIATYHQYVLPDHGPLCVVFPAMP